MLVWMKFQIWNNSLKSRGGHLEPKTETETRTKSNRTERFGFAVLKPNLYKENGLVLVLAFENRTETEPHRKY